MPEPMGGNAAGSNPGWLLRAGMASCAATAIAMRAAMRGIAITTLAVKVESDSDARGLVGIPDAPTAFGNLRMSVKIGADGVDAAQLREPAAWVKHTHRSVARCRLDHRLRSMLPLIEMWTARTQDFVRSS